MRRSNSGSDDDDAASWTPVVLSVSSSSTASFGSGYRGSSSTNNSTANVNNLGARETFTRRNEDEISISSIEVEETRLNSLRSGAMLARKQLGDDRSGVSDVFNPGDYDCDNDDGDGKVYEVDEIIQELAELVRRKNFLRAKLDEIVSGGKKVAPPPPGSRPERARQQLQNGVGQGLPVKKETPTAKKAPTSDHLDFVRQMVPVPRRNYLPDSSLPPSPHLQTSSRDQALPNVSRHSLDLSRQIDPVASPTQQQAIQKGAMVMVVKKQAAAQQALVYTGVIVEMDEDYVRLDRIRQIDQDGTLIKTLPYTLMFRPSAIVQVMDKAAATASAPSSPLNSTPMMKPPPPPPGINDRSAVRNSSNLLNWKSPSHQIPRRQSTDYYYSSASDKYFLSPPAAKKSRHQFAVGQKVYIKTKRLRLNGTVKSYKHGQLVLVNVYDARENKHVGDEMLLEDDQILSYKTCDLSSTRIEAAAMGHKPRTMFTNFESFMKTTTRSSSSAAQDAAGSSSRPKYVCRPAGYTPSNLPTREARFRSDKLYADSIGFR